MIVKCNNCNLKEYCLARLNDKTITGCGMPLYEAGVIQKADIEVEHTIKEVDNERTGQT